jgi:branched-chain amino acid transport system permease protein
VTRTTEYIILSVITLTLFTAPLYMPQYALSLSITVLMYVVLAVSWMILSAYTGYINLGSAAFFGLGAYMVTIFWPTLPFFTIVLLGGLVTTAFAFAIGTPVLRVRGPYFVILTFGLSQLLLQIATLYESKVKQVVGTILLGGPGDFTIYYSLLILGVLAIATARIIRHTKLGIGLFSIRGDEEAAQSMGVNVTWYKLVAFVISSAFMGCVGAVMAFRWTYIDPPIAFNPNISFQVCIMSILGGINDVRGPVIGAIVLTLISEAFGINFPYHYLIILGVILILIMKFWPLGLLGALQQLWIRLKLLTAKIQRW